MEFYYSPDGNHILYQDEDKHGEFTENSYHISEFLLELIESNFPETYKRLREIYCLNFHGNKPIAAVKIEKFKKARRFIRCNLIVSDNVPDISKDGQINLEYVHCPLKGTGDCKDENIICNPKQSLNLSNREFDIVNLICDCKSDQDIADQLYLSIYTIENHRKNILRKLNLHSKEEIIVWAYNHGLRKSSNG